MRKIAVITGSRAEYGLLYWVIKGIHDDPDQELQLIVTGMHLSPEFGLTVKDIERDGFPITERVEMLLSSDTEEAISLSMGMGMIGFAKIYPKLKPDIIVVLGDRFELHAAVSAAIPFRIPVAHIHGGEATEGAIDESIRHSITKMSHIHFASTEQYKKRIVQMGENPESVYCFGAPGIDNIYKLDLLTSEDLCKELNIPEDKKIGVVTYHPVTLDSNKGEMQIIELLEALKEIEGVFWVFTLTNADTNGRIITKKIEAFIKKYPDTTKQFKSLGQLRYLSLLKHASAMVGNSSSGIIEAPTFKLPVINIGDRQKGRIKAANVIDVIGYERGSILEAVEKAITLEFKESLCEIINPYGSGNASERIVKKLKTVLINEKLVKKKFFEIN